MNLQPGAHLGPYHVLEPLGVGGMGEVWKAMDTRLDRLVAVKVIQGDWASQSAWLDRFHQEAKAVAALNHPNVLGIFDFGSEGGMPFAVMELLVGETLRTRLGRGAMTPDAVIDLAIQVTRGLAAAHGKGIVHRDLKPENLWITDQGHAKILDFGLAKRIQSSGSEEATRELGSKDEGSTLAGTACYMSPEQIRGGSLDGRSDLFALGAVLWESLTGHKAFGRPLVSGTLAAILSEDQDDLAQPPYEVPRGLARLIRRCLEKSPVSRFSSAQELLDALEGLTQDRNSRGRKEGPSVAVLPFVNLSGSADQDYFSDGISEEIIHALMALSGLRVAARTSSFAFRGRQEDVRHIGRELGVQHLLEGSVRVAGCKLRVSAQLISVADGCQVWSERFDRALEDVFEVQDEIARAIAGALEVRLLGGQQERIVRPATQDPEAYDLFLRGRAHYQRRSATEAIACFEAALARDPEFAEAYCGLADSLCIQGFYGGISSAEAFARARAAVEKARALAPDSPAPHLSRAIVEHYFGWDFAREEQELKEAIRINPGAPAPYYWMGALHYLRGMADRAKPYVDRHWELDPLSPIAHCSMGEMLREDGRPEEALPYLERAHDLDPGALLPQMCLSNCLQTLGRPEEAVKVLEAAMKGSARSSTFMLGLLGGALARAGRREEAITILADLRGRPGYVAPIHIAYVEAGLGEVRQAFSSLSRAIDERNGVAWHFAFHEPLFAGLHEVEGFEALRRRIPGA
ncbi:MAG: protein kinase [Acidobacteria bacterium]|nr:protein kinase [Acidobacteriota bacterium]